MTLRVLINKVLDTGGLTTCIREIINYYYAGDTERVDPLSHALQLTVRELLELNKHKAECDILVSPHPVEVSFYCQEEGRIYAMDLSCWNGIIDATILNKANLDENELLSHILWEMTFYGFTQEEVSESRRHVERPN